jgi:hypothetical protein
VAAGGGRSAGTWRGGPRGAGLRWLPGLTIRPEDPATAALIGRLRAARRRGYLTRAEFLAACRWKSPRPARLYARNAPVAVRRVSQGVLATGSEPRRMALLTTLHGVGVPVASAILTLLEPDRYGVLDIRVWRLLAGRRLIRGNRAGRAFSVAQWLRFLTLLRARARQLRVTARALEWSLFRHHRARQRGRLYDPPGTAGRLRARRGGPA